MEAHLLDDKEEWRNPEVKPVLAIPEEEEKILLFPVASHMPYALAEKTDTGKRGKFPLPYQGTAQQTDDCGSKRDR